MERDGMMTNNGVAQKPSETALFAALRRTIAHKAYDNEKFGPDYLAEIFLPGQYRFFLKFKKIRENTKNRLDSFLPGLNEYMIARTAYFDRLFVDGLNKAIPQIVLMGAGYDSRPYRFAKLNRNTEIFELDIAPTQNRKKKCLIDARIEIPEHVKFVPIDFNQESIGEVLDRAGYKTNKKTLFIWEGVSYYLDAETVDENLDFVSQSSTKGSSIAFDYTISISDVNIDTYYGVEAFAQTMEAHHADEALLFSIDEGTAESFLEQRKLTMVEHLNNEEIENTFLVDDDGILIGRITGHFRFVVASKLDS